MVQKYRSHRYPASKSVEVHSGSSRGRAQILDVNQNGARLVGAAAFRRGEKVSIVLGFEQIHAIVRWVGKDRCGVSFVTGLTTRQLSALKSKGIPGRMTPFGQSSMRELR